MRRDVQYALNLLLPPYLYLPVCLSLFCSPVRPYFIHFLTPLNSILAPSLNFSSFLPLFLLCLFSPSPPLLPTFPSQSACSFTSLCFSSVQFHSRPATERSRSRLILCLDTTSQLILARLCVCSLRTLLLSAVFKCQCFSEAMMNFLKVKE